LHELATDAGRKTGLAASICAAAHTPALGMLLSRLFKPSRRAGFNDPLGTNGTIAQGINDAGQIVGSYDDSNQARHGRE
jgi:hypothetical protein